MKKLFCICAALFFGLSAMSARAADVTGNWTAEMKTPDGNSMQLNYTLKQDGASLTGTTQGPQGDQIELSNGKVDGNKLSFDVSFSGMTFHYTGTISDSGSDIKLSAKTDQGDFPPMEITLTRAKANQ
jgi:hypothetical protein